MGILCEVATININRPLGRRQYTVQFCTALKVPKRYLLLHCCVWHYNTIKKSSQQVVCLSVCVLSSQSHLFWTSDLWTHQPGHTGGRSHRIIPFLHLPSAVLALIFIARRIQPFLSLVKVLLDFKGKFEHEEKTSKHPTSEGHGIILIQYNSWEYSRYSRKLFALLV